MDNEPNPTGHDKDPLAQRLETIERFGDAILHWVMTLTLTLCVAAFLAAYAAQYLAGK